MAQESSVFDFSVESLHGEQVKLAKFCDKKVLLIANFSTSDGEVDKQFLVLKELKQKYCNDIAILLFPCSQFGEPMAESTNSEIYCWCKFDGVADYAHIFGRVDVAGARISPLFKFLTDGGGRRSTAEVDGNFTKFIVNERGQVCSRHGSSSALTSIVEAINRIV